MAEVIFTDEEKSLASYLDMDDASLGRFTKHLAVVLEKMDRDPDGLHRVSGAAMAMRLASLAAQSNATDLSVELKGHTYEGRPTGDWKITVKRVRKPMHDHQERKA